MMLKPSLVSIIIPTYNRAGFIGDALDSILSQTYLHWECIVVDDGSSDNTSEVMMTYCKKDKRIQYLKRPENCPKGSNGSRNHGISKSKGAFIAFCDDDDFWLYDKLERQINVFHENPDVGLVTSNIEFVNEDGVRTGRIIKQTGNHGYVFEQLLLKNRMSMITPMLKREVFKKVGYFNTDFIISEDWEFWRRVSYYYHFYALRDVLACVRLHGTNISKTVQHRPIDQYLRYRALNKALFIWGEGRFTKQDKQLINKVEWQRYKQLMQNHCPGMWNKVKFGFTICTQNLVDGIHFVRLFLTYQLRN